MFEEQKIGGWTVFVAYDPNESDYYRDKSYANTLVVLAEPSIFKNRGYFSPRSSKEVLPHFFHIEVPQELDITLQKSVTSIDDAITNDSINQRSIAIFDRDRVFRELNLSREERENIIILKYDSFNTKNGIYNICQVVQNIFPQANLKWNKNKTLYVPVNGYQSL